MLSTKVRYGTCSASVNVPCHPCFPFCLINNHRNDHRIIKSKDTEKYSDSAITYVYSDDLTRVGCSYQERPKVPRHVVDAVERSNHADVAIGANDDNRPGVRIDAVLVLRLII